MSDKVKEGVLIYYTKVGNDTVKATFNLMEALKYTAIERVKQSVFKTDNAVRMGAKIEPHA